MIRVYFKIVILMNKMFILFSLRCILFIILFKLYCNINVDGILSKKRLYEFFLYEMKV